MEKQKAILEVINKPMSAEAWKECGKAHGWQEANKYGFKPTPDGRQVWKEHALEFHEINLTEGRLAAVTFLRSVCGIEGKI